MPELETKDILSPKVLAGQEGLTEEQEQAIKDKAYGIEKPEKKPIEFELSPEKKPVEEKLEQSQILTKSDDEILQAKEEDLTDVEKFKKGELVASRKEADDLLVKADESGLSEEDKQRRTELIKNRGEAEAAAEELTIKEYAEKHNLSSEDAKKEVESIRKIETKYEKDSFRQAKTILSLQRSLAKREVELKTVAEQKAVVNVSSEQVKKQINANKFILNGKALLKEDIVRIYRENSEKLTETMEDDTVFELACEKLAEKHNSQIEKSAEGVVVKAKEKKAAAFLDLNKYDQKFHEAAKQIIGNLPEKYIAGDTFNVDEVIRVVKGDRYDQDKKAEYERGKKDGEEKGKILGLKPPVGGGKPIPKSKKTVTLNEKQKRRALEMYDGTGRTDQEKYEAYVRVHPKEFGLVKKED